MNIQGLIFFRIEGFYLWGDGVDQTLLESLTQRVRKFLKSPEHSRSFDEQDFTYPWASTLLAFFVKEIIPVFFCSIAFMESGIRELGQND